jgi:hypothetical protein
MSYKHPGWDDVRVRLNKPFWHHLSTKDLRFFARSDTEEARRDMVAQVKNFRSLSRAESLAESASDETLEAHKTAVRSMERYVLSQWLNGPKRVFALSRPTVQSLWSLSLQYLAEGKPGFDMDRVPHADHPDLCGDLTHGVMIQWPYKWSADLQNTLQMFFVPREADLPVLPTTWIRGTGKLFFPEWESGHFYCATPQKKYRDQGYLIMERVSRLGHSTLYDESEKPSFTQGAKDEIVREFPHFADMEPWVEEDLGVSGRTLMCDLVAVNLLCALADFHEVTLPPARKKASRRGRASSRRASYTGLRIDLSEDALFTWVSRRQKEAADRKRDRNAEASEAQSHHGTGGGAGTGTRGPMGFYTCEDHTWKPLIRPENLREGEEILEEVEKVLPSGKTQLYYRVSRLRSGRVVNGEIHDNEVRVRTGPDDIGGE